MSLCAHSLHSIYNEWIHCGIRFRGLLLFLVDNYNSYSTLNYIGESEQQWINDLYSRMILKIFLNRNKVYVNSIHLNINSIVEFLEFIFQKTEKWSTVNHSDPLLSTIYELLSVLYLNRTKKIVSLINIFNFINRNGAPLKG